MYKALAVLCSAVACRVIDHGGFILQLVGTAVGSSTEMAGSMLTCTTRVRLWPVPCTACHARVACHGWTADDAVTGVKMAET